MIKLLKSIFTSRNVATDSISNIAQSVGEKPIREYFLAELKENKYIKHEHLESILKHLTHDVSLTKTSNTLTSNEKKALGLNTRLSITKELLEVLTPDGLALNNPKVILEEIYNKATITKLRDDNFEKSIKAGIKKFTLNECGDGSECEWCKANLGIEYGPNILQLIRDNCKCTPYSKCFITPIVEF